MEQVNNRTRTQRESISLTIIQSPSKTNGKASDPQHGDMFFRPVSGSSTRVSWFPIAAPRCSTEDTNPSEKGLDAPDRGRLHSPSQFTATGMYQTKTMKQRCLSFSSRPAGSESVARQHSCSLSVCPGATHSSSQSLLLSLLLPLCQAAAGVYSVCYRQIVSMFWGAWLSSITFLLLLLKPKLENYSKQLPLLCCSSLFLSLQYAGIIKKKKRF